MDGLGNINWWGFSPALDFQSVLNNSHENAELNFLLVGCGDPRHLLRTFASKSKWPKRKLIRFYVYEPRLELYARDLLMLSLAIEHPARRGIQEKTELFMEIFGNIQVRQQTADYIRTTSNELIKCITDFDYMKAKNLGCFDLSLLKFKERDFLESIFKYWRADTKKFDYFPAKKCWDLRLRTYLQTRYDTRSNSFDWDYSMKFADRKNTHVINSRLYASWRETGNGFELRDSNYDQPNLTLSSATAFDDPRKLDKVVRRGYFGDIVVSPYLCYGIESEKSELFRKANDNYVNTALDVTKANLNAYMQSIAELKGYKHTDLTQEQPSAMKIEEIVDEEPLETNIDVGEYLDFDDVQFVFLPMSAIEQDLCIKNKYDNFFDLVYFSNSGFSLFEPKLKKIFKQNAALLCETTRYMIELSNEQILKFSQNLTGKILTDAKFDNFANEVYKYDDFVEENVIEGTNGCEAIVQKIKIEQLDYLRFLHNSKD